MTCHDNSDGLVAFQAHSAQISPATVTSTTRNRSRMAATSANLAKNFREVRPIDLSTVTVIAECELNCPSKEAPLLVLTQGITQRIAQFGALSVS